MRFPLIAAILAVTLPVLSPAALAAAPIPIVAAENFYGEVAAEIGGAHVAVTSILANPDADPHLFETSPSTARDVSGAAIVIYNGADYDPWMQKLIAASPRPERTVIVAADLTGHKSGDNPHLWYDPPTLPAVAKALAAALTARDPANAAAYAANLERFDAALLPVTAQIAAIRAAHAGLAVTATEPVFGYMATALGFTMLNEAYQIASMNDTEPPPSAVVAFEQSLKTGAVKLLIYNRQVSDTTTARLLDIAKAAGVPVVGVTETAPPDQTIAAWFTGQLDAIAEALK